MVLRRFFCGMTAGLVLAATSARSAPPSPPTSVDLPDPPSEAPAWVPGRDRGVSDAPVRRAQAPAAPAPRRPAVPTPPTAPAPPTAPPAFASDLAAAPALPVPFAPAPTPFTQEPGGFPGFASFRARTLPEVMGDQGALSALQFRMPPVPQVPPVPGAPGPRQTVQGAALLPFIRQFKIAEMESPRPLDRVYFTFNFYDDLNASINRRLGADVSGMKLYRETFGLEKTFLDQRASIGLRLPLNTLSANSGFPGLGGSSTSVGDIAVILKYVFHENRETGDLFSGGMLISAPTGPAAFAGSPATTRGFHDATLQPYVGFIKTRGEFFLQGFSSVDVPLDARDVTVFYNDLSAGYFVYHDRESGRTVTGLAPTLEAHLTTPLNHRGFRVTDRVGTPDVLDLTYGLNVEILSRSYLRIGLVTPVTGPRPFSLETFVQYSMRF